MVVDALRAYVQLASGLTDVTRERAVSAAKALVAQVSAMSDAPAESTAQVRALADELAKMARTNRDVVVGMVRSETERAVASVGAASHEELVALQLRVSALEASLSADGAAPAASDLADEHEVDTAETARPPTDPAHATPADMPRHEPEHPVDPPPDDVPPDDAPPDDAPPDDAPPDDAPPDDAPAGDAPAEDQSADDGGAESATADDDGSAAAPQDPSPPDVSTS